MNVDRLQQIQSPIAAELEQYTALFSETMHTENPLLQKALSHLLQKTGKLMRPTLTLLSARLTGQTNEQVFHVALALELLHTATLIHDDVVDESDMRRGQASINSLLGNKVAVLTGDFVLSCALQHAALTHNTQVVSVVSELGQTLADGELFQLHNTTSEKIDEASYYEVIRKKTASLFAACAQLGALMSGATADDVERMRQFGQLAGMCFQLRDDMLDLSSSDELGKPTGNDLREGKLTLPVIHALKQSGDSQMLELALKTRRGEASAKEQDTLARFAIEHGGVEYAQWSMNELRMMANGLIFDTEEPDVATALRGYIDFIVDRNR